MKNSQGNGIATIKDVARLADTSISTVSRIINNKGGVSEDLELRIKQAIKDLKYKPNTVARALKAKTTKILGLVVPSIENAIFPQLIKVVEDAARKYGFSTILCNSDGDIEKEISHIQLLVEKQVDGVILNALGIYDERLEILRETNTPVIVIGKKIEGFKTTNVTIDNFKGAYSAVTHLIEAGRKNVAFLLGQLDSKSAISNRFEGYKSALKDNGIPYRDELVVSSSWIFEGGVAATGELIQRGVKFDSIIASNDMIAIGCIDKLLEEGYAVPGDVSVIGYDNTPISRIVRPHLSTVNSPVNDLGTEAVKMILRIIFTKNDKFVEKVLEPELVIRNSSV